MKTIVIALLAAALAAGFAEGVQKRKQRSPKKTVPAKAPVRSYRADIAPLMKLNCLPCHTEDQMNPSELYLDSYENILKGGKHGAAIIPGNGDSSLMLKKLGAGSPFGDPMPLKRKTPLSADTVKIIREWIDQGAKDN